MTNPEMPDFLREQLIARKQRAVEAATAAEAAAKLSREPGALHHPFPGHRSFYVPSPEEQSAQIEQARLQAEALERVRETARFLGPTIANARTKFKQTSVSHARHMFKKPVLLAVGAKITHHRTLPERAWSNEVYAGKDGMYSGESHPAIPARSEGVLLTADGELMAYDVTNAQEPTERNVIIPRKIVDTDGVLDAYDKLQTESRYVPGAERMQRLLAATTYRYFDVSASGVPVERPVPIPPASLPQ